MKSFGQELRKQDWDFLRPYKRAKEMMGLTAAEAFAEGHNLILQRALGIMPATVKTLAEGVGGYQHWQKQLGGLSATLELSRAFLKQQQSFASLTKELQSTALGLNSDAMLKWQTLTMNLSNSLSYNPGESLKNALGEIASQLTNTVLQELESESLSEVIDITEELCETSSSVIDQDALSSESVQKFEIILERLTAIENKLSPTLRSKVLQFMAIIGFLLSCYSNIHHRLRHHNSTPQNEIQQSSEYVTKKEWEQFSSELFRELEKLKQNEKDSTRVERESIVRIKPIKNAPIIEFLPENTFVIKLDTNKKWVYVGYRSPLDSLPQHGWVLKKYLRKNKLKN